MMLFLLGKLLLDLKIILMTKYLSASDEPGARAMLAVSSIKINGCTHIKCGSCGVEDLLSSAKRQK